MDSYIEIKKNATGHYYFTYRYDDTFMAVSSSFSSRSSLESHMTTLRLQAPNAATYLEQEDLSPPCFVIHSTPTSLYLFEYINVSHHPLIQSEYCSSLNQCFEYIQIFSETISVIRVVDQAE